MNVCMLFFAGSLSLSVLVGCGESGASDTPPVSPFHPDLRISSVTSDPATPVAGHAFQMTAVITNDNGVGTADSPATTITLKQALPDSSTVMLGTVAVPSLRLLETFSAVFAMPASSAGIYTLQFTVAPVSGEPNLINNTSTGNLTIAPAGSG